MSPSTNKTLLATAVIIAGMTLFASCGTTFMVAADDVYGNVPTREQERRQKLEQQWTKSSGQRQDDASTEYAYGYPEESQPADTFDYDNYYDYEYSSRLRRFQDDDRVSDDYYSDYYTNTYWYDADPYSYGTSIYLGYDWWYPRYTYYRPGWYLGFSYGPFSFGYGSYWDYYRYPYFWSYGHGYGHGYWNGYWDGYWDGRYGNCYDYCYNPYDRNTYTQSYYGRRTRGSSVTNPSVTTGAPVRRGASSANVSSAPSLPTARSRRTFAERYEQAVGSTSASVSGGTSIRPSTSTTANPAPVRRSSATPSSMMESVSSRLDSKPSTVLPSTPSRPVRPVQPSTPSQPARRAVIGNPAATQNPHSAVSTQTQTVRPRTNGQTVTTPSARPQGDPQARPQPRPYNKPVYDRSRSTSSYVSPRYNASPRNATPSVRPSTSPSSYRSSGTSSGSTTTRSTGSSGSSGSSSGGGTRRTR